MINGYGTRDGVNVSLHYTYARLPNYSLNSSGASVGIYDCLELSCTHSTLPTGSTFNTIGPVADLLPGAVDDTGVEPFNTETTYTGADDKSRVKVPAVDKDGDGCISNDEVTPGGQLEMRFPTRDANKDGKLCKDEYYTPT